MKNEILIVTTKINQGQAIKITKDLIKAFYTSSSQRQYQARHNNDGTINVPIYRKQ